MLVLLGDAAHASLQVSNLGNPAWARSDDSTMPNPINACYDPALCSSPDDVTAEENDAQMNLISAHPVANATPSAAAAPNAQPTPTGPTAPPSPAVDALVSRFSKPAGTHPPVEASLTKALSNCKLPVSNYLLSGAAIVINTPETLGASLLAGAKVLTAAAGLDSCLEQNETQQVIDGNRANLAADCRAIGAIPLTTTDGEVVCAK